MESYVDNFLFGLMIFLVISFLLPAIAGGSFIYYLSGFVPWLAGIERKLMRMAAWGVSFPLIFGVIFSIFFGSVAGFARAFSAAMEIFFNMPPVNVVFLFVWFLGLIAIAIKRS